MATGQAMLHAHRRVAAFSICTRRMISGQCTDGKGKRICHQQKGTLLLNLNYRVYKQSWKKPIAHLCSSSALRSLASPLNCRSSSVISNLASCSAGTAKHIQGLHALLRLGPSIQKIEMNFHSNIHPNVLFQKTN